MGAFYKPIWIKNKNIEADETGEWFKMAGKGKVKFSFCSTWPSNLC